jgi:hypothetical protein
MKTTIWHRNEARVLLAPLYPVMSKPHSTTHGAFFFPAYQSTVEVGVKYEVQRETSDSLLASPFAPTGAVLLNTVKEVQTSPAPGVTARIIQAAKQPPKVRLSGSFNSVGEKACDLVLQVEGIWPIRGNLTIGGSEGVRFVSWLRSELVALGDPVDIRPLRYFLTQKFALISVTRIDVFDGGEIANLFIQAQAVEALIGHYFDTMGSVAAYKTSVSTGMQSFSISQNVTATFPIRIELDVP